MTGTSDMDGQSTHLQVSSAGRDAGFIAKVIQAGLNSGQLDFEWIPTFDTGVQRAANRLADRQTRHTAPNEYEIAGAMTRILLYINFALESLSHGDEMQAVRVLKSTALPDLLRRGQSEYLGIQSRLRSIGRRANRRYGRLMPESIVIFDMAEYWSQDTLEEVGRKDEQTRRNMQRTAWQIWFMENELMVGEVLEKHFRDFFRHRPPPRYAQCFHNLAVNVALHHQTNPNVSFTDIQRFLVEDVPGGQPDHQRLAAVRDQLMTVLQSWNLLPPQLAWFKNALWTTVVRDFISAAAGKTEEPLTPEWCRRAFIFYPEERGQMGQGQHVDVITNTAREQQQIIADFLKKPRGGRLADLRRFDGYTGFDLLSAVQQQEGFQAAAVLLGGLGVPRTLDILLAAGDFQVDDLDDPPDIEPEWLYVYLQSLKKRKSKREAIRATYYRLDKSDARITPSN